jgi:hypothetical protein
LTPRFNETIAMALEICHLFVSAKRTLGCATFSRLHERRSHRLRPHPLPH